MTQNHEHTQGGTRKSQSPDLGQSNINQNADKKVVRRSREGAKPPQVIQDAFARKKMGRPKTYVKQQFIDAMQFYETPDANACLPTLTEACVMHGFPLSELYKHCDLDKDIAEAHARARKARSAQLRDRYDKLLQHVENGTWDREKFVNVQAANVALKQMAWLLERDNRAEYGAVQETNLNITQTIDFAGLSDGALEEVMALMEQRAGGG